MKSKQEIKARKALAERELAKKEGRWIVSSNGQNATILPRKPK